MAMQRLQALMVAVALALAFHSAAAQESCYVQWSISNSYTVASQSTSYVTLNLYASTKGPADIEAPYNITIYNPAYYGAFSWNFEVTSMEGGVIAGVTDPADSSWETLLAGGKNVVNMGGNVETSTLGAGPELITINGIVCTIQQLFDATMYGTPGEGGSTFAQAAAAGLLGASPPPPPPLTAAGTVVPGSPGTPGSYGAVGTPGSYGTPTVPGMYGTSAASGSPTAASPSPVPSEVANGVLGIFGPAPPKPAAVPGSPTLLAPSASAPST